MTTATTDKVRIALAQAEAFAEAAREILAPFCDRLEVGGSIRRRKADIGDVELVAIPKTAPAQVDLFGTITSERDLLHERCEELLRAGVFAHRPDKNGHPAFGHKFKRLLFTHDGDTFPLDLFAVPPAEWGVAFTIRTGSSGFTHRLVMSRLYGGMMPAGMREHGNAIWDGGRLVPTPEEADVFAALCLAWLPPELRTDDAVPARLGGLSR